MKSKGIKFDSDKLRYDLIPPEVLEELAEVLTHGAEKYDDNNWQNLEDFDVRFYAALMRHLEAWRAGIHLDSESGLLHLSQALTNCAFLLWKEIKKLKAEGK